MTDPECLFCKIVAGEIPADVVLETETLTAFRDINPAAPTHVLVIPKEHLDSLDAVDARHVNLLGEILLAAKDIARTEGIAEGGYRTVINTGVDGGQSVGHVHLHLMGGRSFGWPSG